MAVSQGLPVEQRAVGAVWISSDLTWTHLIRATGPDEWFCIPWGPAGISGMRQWRRWVASPIEELRGTTASTRTFAGNINDVFAALIKLCSPGHAADNAAGAVWARIASHFADAVFVEPNAVVMHNVDGSLYSVDHDPDPFVYEHRAYAGNLADLIEGLQRLCLVRGSWTPRAPAAPADDRVFELDWL